ncbi:MAG: PspC domain-containing protein [Propionibacteriaceae bacterium]|jgi:phage shock protein PspC (stress-responsive transcriptional regulator)|nr:PspC domain-containing protein [Propionibacteriaceae bacterium]
MSASLTRSRTDKVLGGVCGGIAAFTKIDVAIIRVIAALGILFFGAGLLVYILLWLLLPMEGASESGLDQVINSIKNNRS